MKKTSVQVFLRVPHDWHAAMEIARGAQPQRDWIRAAIYEEHGL